jgi:hypothetical protein
LNAVNSVTMNLKPIAGRDRRAERAFWQDFETERPRILGSLLDAVSLGLSKLPGIHLGQLPWMADFALWATACETAFWPAGTFARAYQANRRAAVEDLIEGDPVAARAREIMATRQTWTGSAFDLVLPLAGREVRELLEVRRLPRPRQQPHAARGYCVAARGVGAAAEPAAESGL